ncbi:MAG: hypothetical protein N2319_03210 [Candidatus Kapabacteria bacterium]|nr:hypothetical protein [Candidatus Kapabacteria bacterium]
MTRKGNRRNGQPILIRDNKSNGLERIPLDAKTFNEDWIQKLINNNPEILPINEIDSAFTPVISIGREISTTAGYIDNLFISPEGYLTIVETKLWRNPEARREVVGQILDYAKELNKWSFTDLDNAVKLYNQTYNKNSDGLITTVKKFNELDEADESYFIDNVSRNLKRGRFLLLIVGDGIRESLEEMVEYLTQTPQLYFTLALVELLVYKLNQDDSSLIVIPQLVTRTREITRAIVKIEGSYTADLKVSIKTDLGTESTKQQNQSYKRLTITAEDFFEQLAYNTNKETVDFAQQVIKDSEELGLYIEWNSGSFSIKLPDPQGSGIKIGIVNIDRGGLFYLGYSRGQFEKLQLPLEICYSFAADTAKLLPGIKQRPDKPHIWNKYSTIGDLKKVYPQFMERVKKYIDDIINEGQKISH